MGCRLLEVDDICLERVLIMFGEQLIHLVEWQMAIFSFPLSQFFSLQLLNKCIKKSRKAFLITSANAGLLTFM